MARRADDRGDAPNTAQLRGAIPSGRTPSIDSAHEPAVASFDTDDEAAGRPVQQAAIEQALAHEGRMPREGGGTTQSAFPAALWAAAAIAAAAVLGWIFLS